MAGNAHAVKNTAVTPLDEGRSPPLGEPDELDIQLGSFTLPRSASRVCDGSARLLEPNRTLYLRTARVAQGDHLGGDSSRSWLTSLRLSRGRFEPRQRRGPKPRSCAPGR